MADLLVAGDTVSVQAWEMRPWVHPQAAQGPVTLQSGSAAEKAKLQEMLPLTPQAGSQGGHDTEATITDITRSLGTDAGAVVVLLVPKAMSTSPAGQRVMGANHPDYLAALRSWRRVGQMNESGASDVLSFSVTPSPGRTTTRTLDSVIVAPTRFAGPSIPGGGTRTALLGNRAAAGQPATPARPETAPEQQPAADPRGVLILLGILLLAVLAAVAWFLLRPKPLVLSVAGQSFALADYKPGQEVCFLVGPGFAGGAGARAIRVENPSAPPDRLATFLREGRGVRVKNGLLKVQYHNNITAGAVVVLRQEGKHRLVLGGETHADPALPPETVTLEVDALLAPMRR